MKNNFIRQKYIFIGFFDHSAKAKRVNIKQHARGVNKKWKKNLSGTAK
jgi:hypothetical protein